MSTCQEIIDNNTHKMYIFYIINTMELKKYRKKLNKTQAEMAKYLKITTNAYQNYELGKRTPDINTLIKLADYFHVTIDTLIGHETDRYLDMSFLTETQVKLINKIKDSTDIDCAKLESYLDGMKNR